MKKPVPPSNFRTRDPETQVDLRRLRDAWQDLLDWITANKTTVDLSAYDTITGNNARYLLRAAADFASFATKATPVAADVILLEDSAAGGAKKQATLSTLATAIGASAQIGGSYPLWTTPATLGRTPGTIDLEFDSTTIPAALTFWDVTNSATRTPSGNTSMFGTVVPSGTAIWADCHTTNNGRASWLRVQTTAVVVVVAQPVTLPVSAITHYWSRVHFPRNGNDQSPYPQFKFGLYGATGGHPDFLNYISTGVNVGTAWTGWISAGVSQSGTGNGVAPGTGQEQIEYLGVTVDNTVSPLTYNLWYAFADGNGFVSAQQFLATAAQFTPGYIGWEIRGSAGGTPAGLATKRYGMDFVRQSSFFPF